MTTGKIYTVIVLDGDGEILDVETLDQPLAPGEAPPNLIVSIREGYLNGGDSVEIERRYGKVTEARPKGDNGELIDVTVTPAWSETAVREITMPAGARRIGWVKASRRPDVVGVRRSREYVVFGPSDENPTWIASWSEDGRGDFRERNTPDTGLLAIFPVSVRNEFARVIDRYLAETASQ